MAKRTVNFREELLEDLANPEEAALYLNAAAEDSEEMLLVALRDIAEAKQMAHVPSTPEWREKHSIEC
jgi:DNA-binding phage protein